MNGPIRIFREFRGGFQFVGELSFAQSAGSFSYAAKYLESPDAADISLALPLQEASFSPSATRAFFEGLLPEGSMRELFASSLHARGEDYLRLLSRLNNESVGALLFCDRDTEPEADRSYTPLSMADLERFARQPKRTALEMGLASRLSLAGAQSKIGLYCQNGAETVWYLPQGSASSTHIVKASDGTFPHQTINEAFCLAVARQCGFDVANAFLIRIPGQEPLLAVERFDRIKSHSTLVQGLPMPCRLHQEDFCQAAQLPSYLKYEPTDGNYLSLGARIINAASSDPFGDKVMFFNRILLDYLLGNCDNHLKNHSLLWDADWSARALSPLYDLTCTTLYPQLSREMGVSLCESRRLDEVTASDIRTAARRTGISEAMGWEQFERLREEFPLALVKAEQDLADQGFPEVSPVAEFIREDSARRLDVK